jgi:geranylgeranylglycerol-phosphate geranylgeranyltransferase
MNALPVIRLLRPLNATLAFIAVITGAATSNSNFFVTNSIIASFSALLILMSGNAINDVYDLEADRINRPLRPLPKGEISKSEALWLSIILAVLGISSALFVNLTCFMIASFFAAAWYLYAPYLKTTGFPGNLLVSIGTGACFIFGAFSMDGCNFLCLLFALSAFLLNLGREIVKGVEDIAGDRIRKCKTIAILYGPRKCGRITFFIYVMLLLLSLLPFALGLTSYVYLFFILIADASVIWTLLQLPKLREQTSNKISRYVKVSMVLGMIAFLFGAIFR